MLESFEPKQYLSKRADGSYCVISQGLPLNTYTTKERCLQVASNFGITLPNVVWSAKQLSFIED